MKITGLIFLLFLIKPLTINATEFSIWSPTPLTTEDSLDYINDKLFNGVCSVDTDAGHAFCLDDMDFSIAEAPNTVLALREDDGQMNQNVSVSNPKIILQTQLEQTRQKSKYIQHHHPNSDSLKGGLKLPLTW